ncbi:YiiX/YebB-like N1pC/P60 family cysteine hydrolase [Pseudomonas syringae]|uniref:YiiX/YebB-like N1pC/P60 family cysteine hydrolase n=1 Tax=Pseudomonas syringae TaxID=317 RepID=UPI003F750F8D
MKKYVFGWIRRKQDRLKRITDRRFSGIWMGPPPELLDSTKLLAGDVLFCGQTNQDPLTQIIQNTTDGVYVHCGVYIGDNKVAHAVGSGVNEIPLDEFVGNYPYISVTRCPGANPKRSELIVEFAQRCINSEFGYNFFGAALSPLREYLSLRRRYGLLWNKKPKACVIPKRAKYPKKRYFCSEFVVQCYIECGYIPQGQADYEAGCWSPTGLAEENIFILIGYLSSQGLAGVHPEDPHLHGNSSVLTPAGQAQLRHRQTQRMELVESLKREMEGQEKVSEAT